jgi:lipopolysaccharide transport system ATP-binding protein
VTHSSEQVVAHCTQALLLHNGTVMERGEPRHVVNRYMDLLFGKTRSVPSLSVTPQSPGHADEGAADGASDDGAQDVFSTRPGYNPHEYQWGDGAATILDYCLSVEERSYPSAIAMGQTVTLRIAMRFHRDVVRPILGVVIKTKEGVTVYGANSDTLGNNEFALMGRKDSTVVAEAAFCCRLAPGDYFISLGVATKQGEAVTPHHRRYDAIHFQVLSTDVHFGLVNLDMTLTAQDVTS